VRVGSYHEKLKKLARELKLERSMIFPGFISRRDLPYIYQGAALFIYPTLYDHYSIPLLEALSSGTPALASNLPQFVTLLQGSVPVFDPLNIDELSALMQKVLENPSLQLELAEKGRAIGISFSWRKTALEIVTVYNKLIQQETCG
jgi:glycosyltransferase involved in cell wall biosynthesis